MKLSIKTLSVTLGAVIVASLASLTGCASATDATTDQAALSQSKAPEGDKGRGEMRGRMGHNPDALFARLDKNNTGKIAIADMPEHMRDHMAKNDLNKDGVITKDELKTAFEARAKEHMAKLDTDGDGKISDAEREAAHSKFMTERFQREDKNSDGALTADEVGEKHWQFLKGADTNNDGRVTQDEIKVAFKSGALKRPEGMGPGMGHHGMAPRPDMAPQGDMKAPVTQ